MMGPRQEAQAALFYEFSLDDHVPQDRGVSETLCMRLSPCEFVGSFVEPFWV